MCKHTSPPWRWEPKLLGNESASKETTAGTGSGRHPRMGCVWLHSCSTQTSLPPHLHPSNFGARLVGLAVQPQLCSEPEHLTEASWRWPPALQSASHWSHPDPGTAATYIYAKQPLYARVPPRSGSIFLLWELVRKVEYWPHPRPTESESTFLIRSPGNLQAQEV